MLRSKLPAALLLLSLGAHHPLGAQSTDQTAAPKQSTYRAMWERMQRPLESQSKMPAAQRSALSTESTPQAPAFAGFFAAQTAAGILPLPSPDAYPLVFLTADFNNDGHPDLALVDSMSGIALSLNDGSGHFGAPTITAPASTPSYATYAAAADLNGDGYADIVTVNIEFQVTVLLNQKNGTFAPTATLALPNAIVPSYPPGGFATTSVSLVLGATTVSGFADIVAEYVNSSSNLAGPSPALYRTVFLNDGAANFNAVHAKKASSTLASVETLGEGQLLLADVNHDGKADLITGASATSDTVSGMSYTVDVSFGNGDGTFQPPATTPAVSVPEFLLLPRASLAVASLTGKSSKLDIVIGLAESVYTSLANGDGTYAAPTVAVQRGTAGGDTVQYVGIADLNGDGHPDLVVSGDGALTSYLGKGDGTFGATSAAVAVNGDGGAFPAIALADFNGDGRADFASFAYGDPDVELGLGRGDGTFIATPLLYDASLPLPPLLFSPVVAADFNKDGISDLIGANINDGTILIALGGTGGAFTYKTLVAASTTNYLYPERVTADFNGDGLPDLVYVQATPPSIATTGVAISLSNGDGTFRTSVPIQLPVALQGYIVEGGFAAGDVNGDGKADLVFSYLGDAFFAQGSAVAAGYFVALGNGDGTFKPATFTPFGATPEYLLLAQYHGTAAPLDLVIGDPDIIGIHPQVSLLTGNGDGTFQSSSPVVIAGDILTNDILADDFNKDGRPDLTILSLFKPVLGGSALAQAAAYLYAGNGDGTFAAPILVDSAGDGGDGIYADVNGDGNPDLLFVGSGLYVSNGVLQTMDAGLTVLLGNGDGTFAAPIRYPFGVGAPVLAGNFLGDNTQSVVADIGDAGAAFFMNQGGTLVAITANPASPAAGASITLSAQVTAAVPGRPVPTGSVTFFDAQTQIGMGTLANGTATATIPGLTAGSHEIFAQYGGDSSFQSNTTAAGISVNVVASTPDFAFSSGTSTLTVAPGQSTTAQLALVANSALTGSVTFACSGLPAEATCSFSPSTVSLTPGQSASTTLSVATTAPSTSTAFVEDWRGWGGASLGGAAFAACLLMLPLGRRKTRAWLMVLVFSTGVACLSGCGGGSSTTGTKDPGTPAGTYSLTITATSTTASGVITHSLPVTLVVQ